MPLCSVHDLLFLDTRYLFQDGIGCHFVASMISGLVTTIASMPVDIAKTRLQSMKYVDGKNKQIEYNFAKVVLEFYFLKLCPI